MHEIQLGANIALISCHSYGGCYTLIVRGQRRSYVQIKALRKAVCQFIHVLCGPCWQRLKTTAPSIYIRTVSKLLARDVCRCFAELVYTSRYLPGTSRKVPGWDGTGQDRTGPRNLEGSVVLWSRD